MVAPPSAKKGKQKRKEMQIATRLFCTEHKGDYACYMFSSSSGGKIDEQHKKNSKRGNKRSKDDAASPEVEQEVSSAIHDGIGENNLSFVFKL